MDHISTPTQQIPLRIAPERSDPDTAARLSALFPPVSPEAPSPDLELQLNEDGLALHAGDQMLRGDFLHMLPRLKQSRLAGELLVRAARIKNAPEPLTAIDATAGLGEDSLLLAAAGFHVRLYERNPVIYELLRDTLRRASHAPELADIVARMQLFQADSIQAMQQLNAPPDVILLDPMFPARQKSALVKKKLQVIQKLEIPCMDEKELLLAAIQARPQKLVIKRPPKGPYLADVKPDYSLTGKAVRFDCIAAPHTKLKKYTMLMP